MGEEKEKKQDRRVQRTKRAIRNSFVKLLAEKDVDKITVKELADGADVDRKTVYNYYSGVYDVLDELENEMMKDVEEALREFDFNVVNAEDVFSWLNGLIERNMELYGLLMKIDSSSRMISKVVAYLEEKTKLVLEWTSQVPEEKISIAAQFATAGLFTAYRYWFNSDRKQPLEEFTRDVSKMVLGGIPAYFYK